MRSIIVASVALLSIGSCQFAGFHRVKGNGVMSAQNRAAGTFSEVKVTGAMDVVLAQGTAGVRVEADENLQQYIETETRGNKLYVHTREGYSLRSEHSIRVFVTSPQYSNLEVTGSGDVSSSGPIKGNSLKMSVTGSGDVRLDLDMPDVNTTINGSGSVVLTGRTRSFASKINGSGDIDADNLLSETASVGISGSGSATVFASKKLDVNIGGSGDVRYKGGASVSQSIHGSGSVQKID